MRNWLMIISALLMLAACAQVPVNSEPGAEFRPPEVALDGGD